MNKSLDGPGQLLRGLVPALHVAPWGFGPEAMPDLRGRVVLTTGANTGLGHASLFH